MQRAYVQEDANKQVLSIKPMFYTAFNINIIIYDIKIHVTLSNRGIRYANTLRSESSISVGTSGCPLSRISDARIQLVGLKARHCDSISVMNR